MSTNLETWLPLGSIVRLKDGERPIMVAGFMAQDIETKKFWDYIGYPYPEGRQTTDDYFFDSEMIDDIYQIGYLNRTGMAFLSYLNETDSEYRRLKQEGNQKKSE